MGESERVPAALQGKYDEILSLTDRFCQRHLNEEYRDLCREGAQEAKRQRSEVRRPPRSRRAGCFVGVCGSIAGGDKTEGFPTRRRVIVGAMA